MVEKLLKMSLIIMLISCSNVKPSNTYNSEKVKFQLNVLSIFITEHLVNEAELRLDTNYNSIKIFNIKGRVKKDSSFVEFAHDSIEISQNNIKPSELIITRNFWDEDNINDSKITVFSTINVKGNLDRKKICMELKFNVGNGDLILINSKDVNCNYLE